jgi:hypothetical protein
MRESAWRGIEEGGRVAAANEKNTNTKEDQLYLDKTIQYINFEIHTKYMTISSITRYET